MQYGNKKYDLLTRHNHNMYTMSSMLQKSIRRSDIRRASYAGYELVGKFHKYVWKRLIVISAEDCYGVVTKEIISLYYADQITNEGRKGYDRDPLYMAKAITLLCMARKNRDACYVACNFMLPDVELDPEVIKEYDASKDYIPEPEIPEWVFDYHTLQGRMNGKTDLDMIISEQNALKPLQQNLFDNASWEPYMNDRIKKGEVKGREFNEYQDFKEGKTANPSEEILMEKKDEFVLLQEENTVEYRLFTKDKFIEFVNTELIDHSVEGTENDKVDNLDEAVEYASNMVGYTIDVLELEK